MKENNDGKKRSRGTSRAANAKSSKDVARETAATEKPQPEAAPPPPAAEVGGKAKDDPKAEQSPKRKSDARPDTPKPTGDTPKGPGNGGPTARSKPRGGERKHPGGGAALALAIIALLLALATAGLGLWWWQHETDRTAGEQIRIAGLESELHAAQSSLQQMQGAWQPDIDELRSEVATVAQNQGALRDALSAVRAELGREASDWVFEEAEYLIRIANRRLQFTRDVHTAATALQAADQRLGDLADPAVLPVRKALTDAVLALEAVPQPDIDGMATALTGMAERTDALNLAERFRTPERPPLPDESAEATGTSEDWDWRTFGNRLWEDLQSLVVVRRNDTSVTPMLAPAQQYFLHQNLRLKLEEARLALLQRNQPVFRDSLAQAQAWLQDNFATGSAGVRSMLQRLEQMQGVDIAPSLPDISRPLRVLDEVRQNLSAGTAEPTAGGAP